MPDYNIYIHAIGTGSNGGGFAPTTPWSQREGGDGTTPTQAWGGFGGSGVAGAIAGASRLISNPDSIVAGATSSVFKSAAYVACAALVVRTVVFIGSKVEDYNALLSGDEVIVRRRQDVLQGINNLFHPFSASINNFKQKVLLQQENDKRVSQRQLLGDSVINSYTGRGV